MAKIVFKRLVKQNYIHSEMELLGIQKNLKKKFKPGFTLGTKDSIYLEKCMTLG